MKETRKGDVAGIKCPVNASNRLAELLQQANEVMDDDHGVDATGQVGQWSVLCELPQIDDTGARRRAAGLFGSLGLGIRGPGPGCAVEGVCASN